MSPKKQSWKKVIEVRQKESYIGRADYLAQFSDNFLLDIPNYLLFFVIGEGGVGKSALLKQFEEISKNQKTRSLSIICDDEYSSPVSAMGYIAEQLAKFHVASNEFNERYKTYRIRKEEIESDPKAPRGVLSLVVHGMTDFAIRTARRAPGVGVFAEYLDEKEAGNALTEGMQYLIDRIGNKDEIQLLREPERILTPLFINLLNKACEDYRLVLIFDVFERTREALEPWLLELLDFKFGEFTTGLSFVISGRDNVDQHWTRIASSICYISLEPFTFEETKAYLRLRKISNKKLVDQIFEYTGGLPVLVELLAGTNPRPDLPLPDISKDAVKRFLQWIPEEERRWVALLAAIPHKFNLDVLSVLLEKDARSDFNWLSVQSYIRTSTTRGWFYHEKVRELMLRYIRNTRPHDLTNAHERLARFFENNQASLEIEAKRQYLSETWCGFEIEKIYHLLSVQSKKNIDRVVNAFVESFRLNLTFSKQILQTCQQVKQESDTQDIHDTVNLLVGFYEAYESGQYKEFIVLTDKLHELYDLTSSSKISLYSKRALALIELEKYQEALEDLEKSIALQDDFIWAIANRGYVHQIMKDYEKALDDFNRVIALDDKNKWAFAHRGYVYRRMREHEKALSDLDIAISLDENDVWAIHNRAHVYRLLDEYEKSLSDYDRALSLDGKRIVAIFGRGRLHRLMGNNELAIKDFDNVVSLDKNRDDAFWRRAEAYISLGKYDKALLDIETAISLDEKNSKYRAVRGEVYWMLDDLETALQDFESATQLENQVHWAYEHKSVVLRSLNRLDDAVSPLFQADDPDEPCESCIAHRGELFRRMGNMEKALNEFKKAIDLNNDEKSYELSRRAAVYQFLGDIVARDADINKVLGLTSEEAPTYYNKAIVLTLRGDFDIAMDSLIEAIKRDASAKTYAKYDDIFRPLSNNPKFQTAISLNS